MTTTPHHHTYLNPSITVAAQPDGTLTVVVRSFSGGTFETVCDAVLDPDHARDLMISVANAGAHALSRAIDNLAHGPCQTCNQHRLVSVPRAGGSTETVYCPDCRSPAPNPNHRLAESSPSMLTSAVLR